MAIENGINPIEFWDMTPQEITKAIEGNQNRLKRELQTSAIIAYSEASLIESMVSRLLDKKAKVPTLTEAFPGVFDDIPEIEQESKPKQQDWRVMKARMEQFAQAKRVWEVNKRGNDNRRTASTNNSQDKRASKGDQEG